ncbi:hypothetical protein NC651_036314 [Populus alba x Populus x berolinensis]|nr:hypothetical protein NC651_036312 [Populus alba x Populus x berolinensis]KAJ6859950.1 hypothetical protein NC651_036314 [Populus alba x Populus x berolinensis]
MSTSIKLREKVHLSSGGRDLFISTPPGSNLYVHACHSRGALHAHWYDETSLEKPRQKAAAEINRKQPQRIDSRRKFLAEGWS